MSAGLFSGGGSAKYRYLVLSGWNGCGEVLIGRVVKDIHRELLLNRNDFMRHCLIVGTTGSGKTTTSSVIAAQLANYGKVVILDWYHEFPALLKGFRTPFKTYTPSPSTQIPFIKDSEEMLTILEDVLSLTPPQSYMLHKILRNTKSLGSPADLLTAVEEYEPSAKWMVESKYALLRKLESLFNRKSLNLFGGRFKELIKSLVNPGEVLIIDLTPFSPGRARRLVCLLLLRLFEDIKLHGMFKERLFIVIDEAHNILMDGGDLVDRLFAEVRKLGMGLIMVTQSPALLSYRILTNANIKIVHALKSRDDLETITKALGLSEGVNKVISKLDVGEAVVDAPSLPSPKVVRIDLGLIKNYLSRHSKGSNSA